MSLNEEERKAFEKELKDTEPPRASRSPTNTSR
jgi:hypothetical protein